MRTQVQSVEQPRGYPGGHTMLQGISPVSTEADRELEICRAVRAHELELNRATAAFEHAVLAPLFLLNGGALVAFITLLGASTGEGSELSIFRGWAVGSAALRAAGLCTGALATYWGYRSQRLFARRERLSRQDAERSLLPEGSAMREVVAGSDSEFDKETEIEKAKAMQGPFQWVSRRAALVASSRAPSWLACPSFDLMGAAVRLDRGWSWSRVPGDAADEEG
jgi:hypothetical protein